MVKLRHPVKNQKGFTFFEVVVTSVIIGIMVLAIATMTPAVLNIYQNNLNRSQSRLVSSTILNFLLDELRFAQEVAIDGSGNLTYDSNRYGSDVRLSVDDPDGDGYGTLVLQGTEDQWLPFDVKQYANLRVKVSFAEENVGLYRINLTFANRAGHVVNGVSVVAQALNIR